MLVLQRNEGERVLFYLDDQLIGWVIVVETHGRQVRLGFELEKRLTIAREEALHRYGPGAGKGASDAGNP